MAAPLAGTGGKRDKVAIVLEGVKSTYNAQYQCTITRLVLDHTRLEIVISERGDGSLGPIQPPEYSRVTLTAKAGAARALALRTSRWDKLDSNTAIGSLVYDVAPLFEAAEGARLTFTYGSAGYSAATLLVWGRDVIERHGLAPLMSDEDDPEEEGRGGGGGGSEAAKDEPVDMEM